MKKFLFIFCAIFILTGCSQKEIAQYTKTNENFNEPQTISIPVKGPEDCLEGEEYDSKTTSCVITCNSTDECNEIFNNDFEFEPQQETDCLDGEQYDPIEKICFYECETDEECAAIEAKLDAQLQEIGQDYFEGEKSLEPHAEDHEQENVLTTYTVQNGKISQPRNSKVSTEQKTFQNNTKLHNDIWNLFSKIAPQESINKYIVQFEIFTDGKEGTLAYVTAAPEQPQKWILGVDIQDTSNSTDLRYSLIHEFAHILTLNTSQIKFNQDLAALETGTTDLTDDQIDELVQSKEKACTEFFVPEGCSYKHAYINQFFQKFWSNKYQKFQEIQSIDNDDDYYAQTDAFYEKYKSEFITDYAATNPGEDIAETFAFFVTQPKPESSKLIKHAKVLFMYDFPELVSLRDGIRKRLAQ